MFVELELFKQEKEVFYQNIKNINDTSQNDEEKQKRIEEANEKFKGQVRRYLPSALNVIKTNFNCDYSIYKVGKDFNSQFQVVETNVRKTKPEVIAEMNEFKLKAESMNLSEKDINKINIAMDVFLTYSEDAAEEVDENKEDYMKHAKVTNSSIVSVPSRVNNMFESSNSEIQHNPYANQSLSPIENQPIVDNGFKNDDYDGKKTFVDPFASIYNGTISVSNNQVPISENQSNNYGAHSSESHSMQSNPTLNLLNESTIQSAMPNVDFAVPNVNENIPSVNNNIFIQGANVPQTQVQPKSNQDTGWKIQNQKDEKPTLFFRILSGVLIIIFSLIISIGLVFLFDLPAVKDILNKINDDMIIDIIKIVLISLFSIIFGMIIIKICRLRTRYVGKFLILPSMITISVMMFVDQIADLIQNITGMSIELIMKYKDVTVQTILFFLFFLFIRSLLRKKEKSGRIKWNFVEKISFIVLIYIVFIPLILNIINIFGITSFNEYLRYIYDYQNSNYIIGGVSILLSIIIIILNKKEDRRV